MMEVVDGTDMAVAEEGGARRHLGVEMEGVEVEEVGTEAVRLLATVDSEIAEGVVVAAGETIRVAEEVEAEAPSAAHGRAEIHLRALGAEISNNRRATTDGPAEDQADT